MRLGVRVEAKGPLFQSDSSGRAREAMRRAVQELVEKGEQELDTLLRPRPVGVFLSVQEARKGRASTGHYRRNLRGRVDNLVGRIDDGNVIYGPWLEGTGSRNATTRFKGYFSFRRTAQSLQKQAPGSLRKQAERLVREMS